MKKLFILSMVFIAIACTTGRKPLPGNQFIPGLAAPLRLAGVENEIFLSDYVPNASSIDSVFIDGQKLVLGEDKSRIIYITPPELPAMAEMRIYSGSSWQSVPVMKSRKENIDFAFDPGDNDYKAVQISADFNGWTPSRTNLEFDGNRWVAQLTLDPGRYQYQLVTDGRFGLDPANPDSVDNNFGGFNSVMTVGLPDRSVLPLLFTKEAEPEEQEVTIGWVNQPDRFLVFWQNYALDDSYLEIEGDELSISVPEEANRMERSYLRIYAWNAEGLSNDLLVPLAQDVAVSSASQLRRSDPHAQVLYNVFIDRFYNADPSNDRPINDPALVLPAADYHGGDIKGVTARIRDGYFESLGVNTIWISPVILNPEGAYGFWKEPKSKFSAYHGYWPISFTLVDPRLGTPEDLRELVREAHAREMNVLLDFVAHHVHELHPYYIKYPDRTTSLYLPDGSLNTEKWDEYRLTTWFDVFLPTLDLQNPEVTEMLADSAVWWIKEYELDGFRHDATKHVPEIFWRTLTKKIKEQVVLAEGREVYQIGETYGGPPLISSYVGAGMLDGQFDFNVYDAAIGVFARQADPFTNLDHTLRTSFEYYGYHNLMGYITGNQDRGRFISYAGGDLLFSENAKAAGWTRKIGVGDTLGYRKLAMLNAFNMTIPGLPVIYYGDEFGLPGGNDPDSRRMMKFEGLDPLEARTLAAVKRLAALRNNNLALVYGNMMTLQAGPTSYVFARRYFDDAAIVIFNKSNQPADLEVALPPWLAASEYEAAFGHGFSSHGNTLNISMPPWSFEILTSYNLASN